MGGWFSEEHCCKVSKHDILKVASGARIINPDIPAAMTHAKRYYGLVRGMKMAVEKIIKTTGYPQEEVQRIQNFVFVENMIWVGRNRKNSLLILQRHNLGNGWFLEIQNRMI